MAPRCSWGGGVGADGDGWGTEHESREVVCVEWFWAILGFVVWVLLAFWPARVADRKGHSFIGFFIFSLFFWPAALIVAYLVRDRRMPGYA